jgi:DNA-binding response OmpR family regulator
VSELAPAPAGAGSTPAAPRGRVLLIEDEPAWADILGDALRQAGYEARTVTSGAAARCAVVADRPDVVVLDLGLPDADGLALSLDLKAAADVPILICSATRRRGDTLLGLRLGADDFVTKPCDLDELVERVGALLRTRPAPEQTAPADELSLVLDQPRRQARRGAAAFQLTPAEYRALEALLERPGEVVRRDELTRAIYDEPDHGRGLDMLVARLRAKLAGLGDDAPRIEAERGRGFVLVGARVGP